MKTAGLVLAITISVVLASCVVVVRRPHSDSGDSGIKDGGSKTVITTEKPGKK